MSKPFSAFQLRQLHTQIETPALLIWQPQMEKNIGAMQALADRFATALRPHTKTHKSPFLAHAQLKAGAQGITVAKVSEAEVMTARGIDDIFIANQITQKSKLKRLQALQNKVRLTVGLDHKRQIALLEPFFAQSRKPLSVRIEIDSGLKRCGVTPGDELLDLARAVSKQKFLKLEGLFTHAGHVYSARSPEEVAAIGREEGSIMAQAQALLQKAGIPVPTLSVGSTPTAPFSVQNPAVNEIRPGNYIFYDAMQIALGAARVQQVSLFVLATVVSRPAADRLVIDAGSKALHTDGSALTGHFGLPLNLQGRTVRLSEEHGILHIPPRSRVAIGDPVLLIPNHACAVVNLFDTYHLIDKDLHIQAIPIEGRGKSQ